jgi:hypothetical protein
MDSLACVDSLKKAASTCAGAQDDVEIDARVLKAGRGGAGCREFDPVLIALAFKILKPPCFQDFGFKS